jgi:hypothetical protein
VNEAKSTMAIAAINTQTIASAIGNIMCLKPMAASSCLPSWGLTQEE